MEVRVIAHTKVVASPPGWVDYDYSGDTWPRVIVKDMDKLSEMAGRLCYRSWGRPNPETRTNDGYVQNIKKQKHFSVIEHSSATFYIGGVSRTLTHELVRHRHLSFSQVSQRYVDGSQDDIVLPLGITDKKLQKKLLKLDKKAKEVYGEIYDGLIGEGLSTKEARQAARSALLGSQSTDIVVTGNLRSWIEFIEKRDSLGADVEIRELAWKVRKELVRLAPATMKGV